MTKIIPIAAAALLLAAPATARHAVTHEAESMQEVARKLEWATQSLNERVARKTRRGTRRQQAAIHALHQLEERVERFNDRARRNVHRPQALRKEYRRVRVSFANARDCFRALPRDARARKRLGRVERLVKRLGREVDAVAVASRERRSERHARHRRGDWEVARAPWFGWSVRWGH